MDYFAECMDAIKQLIGIESVEEAPLPHMPFGEKVADALRVFLEMGEKLGFETVNYDNYAGEVVWGEGEKTFGILCHLDVVPAGKRENWAHPPFTATIEDGVLYGRGVVDDKAPAVICLYAMKKLKDSGFVPKHKIKLIVGCNEESGWRCMEHYKKVAVMPDFGISPDANFPAIYAEKGILHLRFEFVDKNDVDIIRGGVRPNVVCEECYAFAPLKNHYEKFLMQLPNGEKAKFDLPVSKAFAAEFGLEVHADGTVMRKGKSAHASTPDKGDNAILPILKYLEAVGAIGPRIRRNLFEDAQGLTRFKDETGSLTMSPDMIEKDPDKRSIFVTVDIRYPSTYSQKNVLDVVDKMGVRYTILQNQDPLFNDKNSPLIKALSKVYSDATGENATPIAIGGGTYARALSIGAAFGPEKDGTEYYIHEPNERIAVKELEDLLVIYEKAIETLSVLDFEEKKEEEK